MTQIANNLPLVTNIYILTNVLNFMSSKVSLYTLSIFKISRPFITSAYRTKTVLIALIATKPDNDY